MRALNAEDMARLGFDRYRSGLLVAEVQEDAIFNPRDLQAGDIILEVDQKTQRALVISQLPWKGHLIRVPP